jgi:hypothetical protein
MFVMTQNIMKRPVELEADAYLSDGLFLIENSK